MPFSVQTTNPEQPVPRYTDAVNLTEFRKSLSLDSPPAGLSLALAGLWWDAKGDWTKAHESAQQDEGPAGSWVHAYLHRKEGDASNAAYWYGRAKIPPSRSSFEEEWDEIASSLLS
jgi:hypothetical protein